MECKILALDMAIKTGWAHSNGASGVWNFSVRDDESSGMRLIRFEAKVHEIAKGCGVDLIVFEQVSVGSGKKSSFPAIKLAAKMQAIIERLSENYDYECCSVNLQTLKAHALPGQKKRDKAAMLASARKRWPDVDIIDDNQADAMWLLDYQSKLLAVSNPRPAA